MRTNKRVYPYCTWLLLLLFGLGDCCVDEQYVPTVSTYRVHAVSMS
jgi:hypothetical protein